MIRDVNVLKKYLNPIFVETGTQNGDGVDLALKAGFETIYSIEVKQSLYLKCVERFKDNKNVKLFCGDSIEVLPKILKELKQGVTFWLDAHINGRKDRVLGKYSCPIIQELDLILPFPFKKTILIDDVRLFRKHRGIWGRIGEEDLIKKINWNGQFKIEYANGYVAGDVMVVSN